MLPSLSNFLWRLKCIAKSNTSFQRLAGKMIASDVCFDFVHLVKPLFLLSWPYWIDFVV